MFFCEPSKANAMSIPAILYDHVPNAHDNAPEVSICVSSIVHRTSAPREVVDNGDDDANNNDGSESEKGTEPIENSEIDDNKLETIFDDIGSDYILVEISSPTQSKARSLGEKIRACGMTIFRITNFESNRNRIARVFKGSNIIAKYLPGSRILLKSFQSYTRGLVSSSIYSSYDWVSETIIDDAGNRLILPGACVTLDSEDSRRRKIADGTDQVCGNPDVGVLIVPADTNEDGLERGSGSSSCVPTKSLSSFSSPWTSNSIMVSAHDLLTIKRDRCRHFGDGREEEEDKLEFTPNLNTQQWAYSLWKIAQRKAEVWYFMSYSYLRRSLLSAGYQFIHSRKDLIQWYKGNAGHGILFIKNSARSENDAFNKSQDPCSVIICKSSLDMSHRSHNIESSRDERINESDMEARSSEYIVMIEMTKKREKSSNVATNSSAEDT